MCAVDHGLKRPNAIESSVKNLNHFKLVSQVAPKDEGLRIASLNVRSLYGKLDEIKLLIGTYLLDILCLNETFLDTSISDSEIDINNYCIVRKDRTRNGGGVAIYIRDSLTHTLCHGLNDTNLELNWCRISPKYCASFLLCCFYRSPSMSLCDSIDTFINNMNLVIGLNLEF